jgi:hypothetical protein
MALKIGKKIRKQKFTIVFQEMLLMVKKSALKLPKNIGQKNLEYQKKILILQVPVVIIIT